MNDQNQLNEGVLKLLQNIKEILLGIALILFAIALFLAGWIWRAGFSYMELFYLTGMVVLGCGGFRIWSVWAARKSVKDSDSEKQGGPHAL